MKVAAFYVLLFCYFSFCLAQGDVCSNPILITDLMSSGSTTYKGVNFYYEHFNGGCTEDTYYPVWFKYIAEADGGITIDTFGSSYRTILQVLDGSCDELTCITYNDDTGGYQSYVGLTVTSGSTYYIIIGGEGESRGEYELNIEFFSLNDDNNFEC